MKVKLVALYTPESRKMNRPGYLEVTPNCPVQRDWLTDYLRRAYGSTYQGNATVELGLEDTFSHMSTSYHMELWNALLERIHHDLVFPIPDGYEMVYDAPDDLIMCMYNIRWLDWNQMPVSPEGGGFNRTCTFCGAALTEQGGSCYCPPKE